MKINKWNKTEPIFDDYLDTIYRDLEHCDVYFVEGKGFAVLNDHPKYALYQKLEIPEIQDVFVLPDHRGQGIATALITHCEEQADSEMIGISVSISPQYGVAQQLYVTLGYKPDGQGVTYNRQPVIHNDRVKVDGDLCLMMVKNLR